MTRLSLSILFSASTLLAQGPNRCASADAHGAAGNAGSFRPQLTAPGLCVFESSASDLVPGDTNGDSDIFVKNLLTGAIERVSVASNGAQASGDSSQPQITPDGRYVVFASRASFTVFDSNWLPDIYRHDRQTGATVLVSCSALGLVGNDGSGSPSISADGRYVAFRSVASNLVPADGNGVTDIFVKDLQTSVVEPISIASPGVWGNYGSGDCVISADGRWVAFDSYASNLVPNDTNGTDDVFARDRQNGTTHRVSVGPNNLQANGPSDTLGMTTSGDVLYRSWASNLVASDTNNSVDIFVGDRIGGWAERVSVGNAVLQANDSSMTASISGDGRFVAFATRSTNLIAGDFNLQADVLLRDRQAGTTVRASQSLGGSSPNGWAQMPAVDATGRYVAYSTWARNTLACTMHDTDQIVVADLAPAVPATFTTFGQGCMGSFGVPTLGRDQDTLPWTGTTLRLAGDSARGASLGSLAFGFSTTSWNGAPLPAALAGFGMGACTLFTSVDLTALVFTQPNGMWTYDFAVPASAGWLGVALHTQGWIVDPFAQNALGATVTNAATMVFGG